jgi:hypothetical protein
MQTLIDLDGRQLNVTFVYVPADAAPRACGQPIYPDDPAYVEIDEVRDGDTVVELTDEEIEDAEQAILKELSR